ncbi:ClbS/DfsB family four-helix bundle protein [Flavobacterium sp. PS2]|uniref:ClbS/DfsB family four-helix bundle protein n=1 Tax=Flavobacterium sp. PS2 TaxID=3384157 RepID=UPI00390C459A
MAVPQNKTELLKEIEITYVKLREDLKTIPIELTAKETLEGHSKNTMMSVNNLVSYLIGWGELVLKWHHKKNNNEVVDFPETGYKWNELGKLAQKFYADYQDLDFIALQEKLDATVNKLQILIESHNNETLYEQAWYKKWTMGRMIQFNTSSPYKNARARIRKWKKENNLK